MKLYVWNIAPNPRRVLITLKEKGIQVPMEDVGVPGKPVLDPAYLEKFGHRRVPILELEDGTKIGEAMAICRYFETLYPDPPMMGSDSAMIFRRRSAGTPRSPRSAPPPHAARTPRLRRRRRRT